MNPYLIEGPAQISFSGGRSSGYMLTKVVEAHQGTLPADVVPLYANTGKEREETLRFIQQLSEHLGITTHWVEYRPAKHQIDAWTEVDFASASRNGEPFAEVIKVRGYVPNPVTRICTQHLKIKPMEAYMRKYFGLKPDEYTAVSGMRADEPGRVARGRARDDINFAFPLYDAGVRAKDVVNFWKTMPFDLELPSIGDKTPHGNCDLCFLKGPRKVLSLIREDPSRADWWIEQETLSGKLFRNDRPNYAVMKIIASRPQLDFDALPAEDTMPCECTD